MQTQEYYRQQSKLSDAGRFAYLFDAVPDDIESICRASQNIIVHYFANNFQPAKERLVELDTRYVEAILQRVMELDDSPLTHERPYEKRFIGCCRDFTMLTVSMLRHKGIPARARYGTAAYFEKGYHIDHVIVEYWNGERWVGVDSQLPHSSHWGFDIRDVPKTAFHVGAWAWQQAHENGLDPKLIGLGSSSPLGGWDFILAETLLDLAALNRQEMLCWESWGLGMKAYDSMSEDEKALLNRLAIASQKEDALAEWQELFQHPHLAMPTTICSFTPAGNPANYPLMVELSL